MKIHDAGALDQRPEVLSLTQTDTGYEWTTSRRTWAAVELPGRRNVYSVHGVSTTGAAFYLRQQPLSKDQALRWKGYHCFITAITPCGRSHMRVDAALVELTDCEDKYTGTKFPAVVAEEYHRHEQLEPMAVNTLRHVLITPKCIELKPGKLVEVAGEAWPIVIAYLLDPHRNEYIIEKVVDL